ncbi:hypothetical protein [Rhodocyclus gracilis]|nr:hypothetical protein [Rhodocyclus gracilis]
MDDAAPAYEETGAAAPVLRAAETVLSVPLTTLVALTAVVERRRA